MDSGLFTFEATVATGFETVLCGEIQNKLPSCSSINTEKGRVYFSIAPENCLEVFSLKGADHLNLLLTKPKEIALSNVKETDLHLLSQLPEDICWNEGLSMWLKTTRKENPFIQKIQSYAQEQCSFFNLSNIKLQDIVSFAHPMLFSDFNNCTKNFSFRVSCYRNGDNHSFTSKEAAAAFGGTIKDKFNWRVDLKNYEIDVLLYINDCSYYACLGLTRMSLHYRNLTICGKLSLRPTVAYNILGLASIQQGDVICDPMAGFGTIPIENRQLWNFQKATSSVVM